MKKIIVIDDEPDMIAPILEKLEQRYSKLSYLYYSNTAEFFIAFTNNELDGAVCVILDLLLSVTELPEENALMTGLIIGKDIRKVYQKLPIVYFSSMELEPIIESHCQEIGNARFISKIDEHGFHDLFNFISTCL